MHARFSTTLLSNPGLSQDHKSPQMHAELQKAPKPAASLLLFMRALRECGYDRHQSVNYICKQEENIF